MVVTLSYHDAGRWLDAQETVEQVPAPPEVVEWMRAFVDEHYVIEPKRRKRPGELQAAGGSLRQSGHRVDGEEVRRGRRCLKASSAAGRGASSGAQGGQGGAGGAGALVPAPCPHPSPPPQGEGALEPPAEAAAGAQPSRRPRWKTSQALTPESDFTPFAAPNVAPEVKNAAMKKLFADPHFNVMDGMDVYIDDYSKPDPIPHAMLRKLASAKFLKPVRRGGKGRGRSSASGAAGKGCCG